LAADTLHANRATHTGPRVLRPTVPWVAYEKEKVRFIVLEDVGGERVTIAVEALAVDFEEFLPKAQKVINTVQWRAS
jgi:hypothetical protein